MNRTLKAIMIFAGALCLTPDLALANALSPFTGYWSGEGYGSVGDGPPEKLRCNANNSLKGDDLRLIVRCANPTGSSLKVYAIISESSGKLSGTWEERTYNLAGQVSGSLAGASLSMNVNGSGFRASIDVKVDGNTLRVSVTPSEGKGRFAAAMNK